MDQGVKGSYEGMVTTKILCDNRRGALGHGRLSWIMKVPVVSKKWSKGNKEVEVGVGRLVVVIDVNPSHGFWTTRLMKLFGHEGKWTWR